MSRTAATWAETFRIRSYETDAVGQASIQTLCNYLQEAAGNHAAALDVSMDRLAPHNLAWVLSRLHVQIDTYPTWGDTIRLETWPSGLKGLYATREFILYDASDDQAPALGRATSAWLVIDLQRRRPARFPAFISEILVPERVAALVDNFARLQAPAHIDCEQRFRVRYSDLDLLQHVNNVRYAEWAVETVPQETLETHQLRALQLHFRSETTLGDTILAQAQILQDDDALTFRHALTRTSDGRVAALAHTRWSAR